MSAAFPHAVVEIVQTTDKVTGAVDTAGMLLKAISAGRAFRQYTWLYKPVLNSSGNFRGMVVSKSWKSVFQVTSDYGDMIGNIALLAALAGNIVEARRQIITILNSNASGDIKAAQLSTQVSSVAIRTLAGIVPSGTHILATSLEGYCQLGGLVTGGNFRQPQQCVDKLQSFDAFVTTQYNKITDGGNIYTFIDTRVNPWISQKLGF